MCNCELLSQVKRNVLVFHHLVPYGIPDYHRQIIDTPVNHNVLCLCQCTASRTRRLLPSLSHSWIASKLKFLIISSHGLVGLLMLCPTRGTSIFPCVVLFSVSVQVLWARSCRRIDLHLEYRVHSRFSLARSLPPLFPAPSMLAEERQRSVTASPYGAHFSLRHRGEMERLRRDSAEPGMIGFFWAFMNEEHR